MALDRKELIKYLDDVKGWIIADGERKLQYRSPDEYIIRLVHSAIRLSGGNPDLDVSKESVVQKTQYPSISEWDALTNLAKRVDALDRNQDTWSNQDTYNQDIYNQLQSLHDRITNLGTNLQQRIDNRVEEHNDLVAKVDRLEKKLNSLGVSDEPETKFFPGGPEEPVVYGYTPEEDYTNLNGSLEDFEHVHRVESDIGIYNNIYLIERCIKNSYGRLCAPTTRPRVTHEKDD